MRFAKKRILLVIHNCISSTWATFRKRFGQGRRAEARRCVGSKSLEWPLPRQTVRVHRGQALFGRQVHSHSTDRAHILGLVADLRWRPRARSARPPTHGEGRALGRGLTPTSTLNSEAPSRARPSSQPWCHGACLNRPTARPTHSRKNRIEQVDQLYFRTRARTKNSSLSHIPAILYYSTNCSIFLIKIYCFKNFKM